MPGYRAALSPGADMKAGMAGEKLPSSRGNSTLWRTPAFVGKFLEQRRAFLNTG